MNNKTETEPKPNDRVYAVSHFDEDHIYIYGFGNYVGDEIPDVTAAGFADQVRKLEIPNPKIILDDGTVVWGCECWWGKEGEFEDMKGNRTVVNIDISVARVKQD